MTLSGFWSISRQGNLDRAKCVTGYLAKMKHAAIRFHTNVPNYKDKHHTPYSWEKSVYGKVKEAIQHDVPEALVRYVVLTNYVDANLYHYMLTGRSVTGILHLINQMPIDWFSKKQPTAEISTYGSEFITAGTCVEPIIDLQNTLRYLGVPIMGSSYMFGDNESVVNSSMKIDAKLHKRHNALSCHRVRESSAVGVCNFFFLPG